MGLTLNEGQILDGKYRIEALLGKGGMGVVVSATHLALGQRVAIKVLLDAASAEDRARFLREAKAAVRLRGEHVARAIDVGELETGEPYIVMEYLEGEDLSALVKRDGALPVADAAQYLLEACEALAEAHSLGFVHRDIKPANLFLARAADGTRRVKVLDFGISKAVSLEGDEAMGLTSTTEVLGSPSYMSPEQMRASRDVDARSDVWSLGVVAFELFTGKRPYRAQSFAELVFKVATEPVPSMREFRADLPVVLDATVLRCLGKDREDRFASVAELAWALAPFAPARAVVAAERASRILGVPVTENARALEVSGSVEGASTPALGVSEVSGTSRELPPTTMAATAQSEAPRRRSRAPLVLVAVALVAAGAWGFGALVPKRSELGGVPSAASAPLAPTASEASVAVSAAPTTVLVVPALTAVSPAATSSSPQARPTSFAPVATPTGRNKKNPLDMQIK